MRSRTERITSIERELESPIGRKKVFWRKSQEYFPVIKIHRDMLAYRIDNSRTTRQQQAYVREHGLQEDFFTDTESPIVQNAQHEILLKMAKSQKGFVENLAAEKQKDELIITRDGYIINGNRRTSALKDIGETYFTCAVLPKFTNPKDIYALEQELQISTDFRLEYDWINELNNIRDGIRNPKYGYNDKELADNLRISIQELRKRLRIIEIVDLFLEWKGDPGNYANQKLDKTRQAFEDIEKGLKQFSDDPYKQLLMQYQLFTMIDNRPDEGRIYEPIRKLIKHFDRIQPKIGIDMKSINGIEKAFSEGDQSDIDFIIGTDTPSEIPFKNSEVGKKYASKIFDAIEDAKAEVEDKKDAESVYASTKIALRKLTNLVVDENTTKKNAAIKNLEAIIETSEELIQELK